MVSLVKSITAALCAIPRRNLPSTIDVSISLFQSVLNGILNIVRGGLPSTCPRNTQNTSEAYQT